jgi:Fe-S-cluster-containing hydrogenase component 2
MAKTVAFIDPEQCDNSPMCPLSDVCKQGAITRRKINMFLKGKPAVDPEKCTGCGICIDNCKGAVSMVTEVP